MVVLAVVFGLFSAVDNPARMAFVQEVVGRDMVRNAVSLNTTLVNVARVGGPTVAAVLVATVGIGWCFVVNAISFGFVIASLISLDTRRLHPVPPVHRGPGQLRAGLRYASASLRLGTRDAQLLYHAAAVEACAGKLALARAHVRQALRLNPQFAPLDAPKAAALAARLAV